MSPAGLLLAAGAGSRMGTPKALVHDDDGTSWLARAVGVLRDGGCAPVQVVLGAAAGEARGLLPTGVDVVVADDWASGMAASLRAGLDALSARTTVGGAAEVAVVTLVDLPDVTGAVVRRVLGEVADDGPAALARAVYGGRPGHPVVLGRDHWAPVRAEVAGDAGARDYLGRSDVAVRTVECGDLAGGRDVDTR